MWTKQPNWATYQIKQQSERREKIAKSRKTAKTPFIITNSDKRKYIIRSNKCKKQQCHSYNALLADCSRVN